MTDPCLDAEVLAAWADGALDARVAAEVEAHASECARCQAMLAAFVRTEPATAPAAALVPWALPWWQSFRLRWLVPVAAAATALAIWVAVPTAPAPETEIAGIPEPTRRPDPAGATPSQVDTNAPGGIPPLAKETPAPREEAPRDAALTRERTDATASAAERRTAEAPLTAAAPAAAGVEAQGRSQAAFRAPADRADSAIDGFVSRDGAVRWRLARAAVERSTDGGATWIAAPLASTPVMNEAAPPARAAATAATAPATTATSVGAVAPASVVVAAGDAPSAAVCWLVGPRGAVWLTADGGQGFRRLTVAGEPDLRAVTARDARSADVTASDGRVFRTDDAGANWTLVP